ncbi:UNVERIFIED_CONTAM: Mrpl2 [Trichonephila clavipes]
MQRRFLTDTLKSVMRLDLMSVKPDMPLVSQCVNNVRYAWRNERVFRKIRGGGRPVREGVVPPEPNKYRFSPVYPEDGQYTTRPLPIIKMGGRHPETGRVVVRTIGGGHKKKFRWVDFKREGPKDGSVLEELVVQVRYDPCRSARIALVASGDHKRWIIAAENTKVGDIIKTSSVIPRIPGNMDLKIIILLIEALTFLFKYYYLSSLLLIFLLYYLNKRKFCFFIVRPVEGDAHPIGALPIGTLVHNIEFIPGAGGVCVRAAGTSAQYFRKVDNKCFVLLPSKRQLLLDEKCMVVVGRVSNINHGSIPIGSPNRLRWLGKRPRSGLWHRKDGYCGRKIRPPKSIMDTFAEREKEPEFYNLTFKN